MKVLICGSRDFADYPFILTKLAMLSRRYRVSEVIHGGANGADALANKAAKELGIPVRVYPADWKKHGKSAGPVRNKLMLVDANPDMVLAFYASRKTPGTRNMVKLAREAGVHVKEYGPYLTYDPKLLS